MTAFNRTPRAASPSSRQGGGDNPPCVSPARPLMSARELDDLIRALPTSELERIMETSW